MTTRTDLRFKTDQSHAPHAFYERALKDPVYSKRLETDTRAALEEMVGPLPEGVEFRVVADTDKIAYLHIPQQPSEREVSDADLHAAQGGSTLFCLSVGATIAGITGAFD
ncbi:hypothetical protein Q5Y75_13145 [Ruegeria sp. 2205SS24-7]|uniref:hypothetical protein n=1 Tax=Ruegeria discodermiae TaxID=3064389 RepID=UPI0027427F79|nr:hypothetical protein [Ruegeria sp. 2205SS24-7]MDP5218169.1 hypothetical protein [Ruegeria sp. 2205SS24-7]